MMSPKSVACCLALGSAMAIVAPRLAAKNSAPQDPATQHVTRQTAPPQSQDTGEEGQRVFEQN